MAEGVRGWAVPALRAGELLGASAAALLAVASMITVLFGNVGGAAGVAFFLWIAALFVVVVAGLARPSPIGPFLALVVGLAGVWLTALAWAGLDEPHYDSLPQTLDYVAAIGGFFAFVAILVGGIAGVARIGLLVGADHRLEDRSRAGRDGSC